MTNAAESVADSEFEPNPEQRAVIEAAVGEWLLVVAGPGTGKTEVAAMRLVHLIRDGLQPAQILVLSFSRSAVATLTRRLAALRLADAGVVEDLRHLAIRTFDSWAFRILRQGGAAVSELLARQHDENIVAATAAFTDGTNAAIRERLAGIRHVIVDEFQDLPGVRAGMVIELLSRLNSGEHPVGFTVLGDPVQSIYRWAARSRGQQEPSDPWDDLKRRMGIGLREVQLTRNHRSTEKLASMATSLRKILQSDLLTAEKKLTAMQRFLERLPASSHEVKLGPDWLANLPEGTVAVLTRSNGEAVRVTKMLLGDSVEGPAVSVRLRVAGSQPIAPAWIAVLLSRFKPQVISRSTFEIVYQRAEEGLDPPDRALLGMPPRESAWRRLARASGAPERTTSIDLGDLRERLAWPDSFPDDQLSESAVVYVTTIHQAKGMEFDNVALLDSRPRDDAQLAEDPLEMANVGFVAVTRAGKALGRIPSECIYKAPYECVLPSGRSRFLSWGKLTNLQFGLPGDIDPVSFVDHEFHDGVEQVVAVQHELAARVAALRGHKVILTRIDAPHEKTRARDTRYEICLQEGDRQGLRLACTSQQVTTDLLDLLWDRRLSLPNKIFNLRIGEVISLAARGDVAPTVPQPWQSSRLWLGITLFGTGDFKTWKRNGK
ncbi:UvrD-helicase domain-containing protein [Variovorax sp. Root411]|uniref:UvrD-helicase domain-containing protein n=1 Tax=Variovorax sp. Root411 TaxID=1736530 RepID=UPI0006FC8105|nr:UvrD-helicase domain-containing protein [Variovorax sp. Root411]KQW57062.1 hypothetical protein ASC92_12420 [Variovorax sp. Root411]